MFSSVIAALLPVVLIILLGAMLRQRVFLPAGFFAGLNKLAFWVGLPCMLYVEIAAAPPAGGDAMRIALTLMGASLGVLLPALALARLLRLPAASVRVCAQGAFRGNLAYVGLPVVFYALTNHPAARATATLALAPTIPFFNLMCVAILLRPGQGSVLRRFLRVAGEIARNPLIVACLAGVAAMQTNFHLPTPLQRTVEGLGRLGLPAALLALGATLSWRQVRGHGGVATAIALLKVAGAPLLGWLIARACGLRGEMLTVCLLFLATPTAVASYVMADQMDADRELAAAIIVVSTLMAFPALAVVMMM